MYISLSSALRMRADSRAHREAAIEQHEERLRQEAADKQAALENAAITHNAPEVEKKFLHR